MMMTYYELIIFITILVCPHSIFIFYTLDHTQALVGEIIDGSPRCIVLLRACNIGLIAWKK